MQQWMKVSLFLCVFGFLKEIRPSEPFIYDFLTGHWRNLTGEQISKEVYPVGTYSNLILLIIVFLITDLCRYKPIIILLGLSGIGVFSMLLWTTSLFCLQIVEVFYGMFSAAEVAYYTYIYAKVDKEHYFKVTSQTRAAILAGRAISGVSSQLLISFEILDYRNLTYVTFAAICAATLWAVFLPPVKQSIYFHADNVKNLKFHEKVPLAFVHMKKHIIMAFQQPHVVKWSIWWSLSTCGYVQVENYMQPLYSVVQDSDEAAYNGAVEAILTILGFAAALSVGYLKVDWDKYGDYALIACSLIQGAFIVNISQTEEIYVCYTFYIVFGIMFHFMVTVTSAQISQFIEEDSYALIFGINTFIALSFNSILTAAVATKNVGFNMAARDQYIVYGGYHFLIGLFFVGIALGQLKNRRNVSENAIENPAT